MRRQRGLQGEGERGEEEEDGEGDSVALLKVIWMSVFGQMISPILGGR